MQRRDFVAAGAGCLAHLAWAGRNPLFAQPLPGRIVTQEPWGTLQEIGSGVWALISTPLQDRTTLCNGGIIAGSTGTLVFEAFGSNDGATWMARQARELAGRPPTHVVLSHYHGDHTNGVAGFDSESRPSMRTTRPTLDQVRATDAQGDAVDETRAALLADVDIITTPTSSIDLGGRAVTVTSRDGHTASDLTLAIDGASITFCGDLVWNRMFPNYRDAVPTHLSAAVRALSRDRAATYVPGHGPLATREDLARYVEVIDRVEEAARRAFEAGVPAAEAAVSFVLPESLGEWMLFSPRYYEVALGAWERELRG